MSSQTSDESRIKHFLDGQTNMELRAELAARTAELAQARQALQRLEYPSSRGGPFCRGCWRRKGEGHAEGCWVQAALAPEGPRS